MKISIITITYNNVIGLKSTIESIITQSSSNFECIIIDGASTDETPQYLESLHDTRLRIISEPDSGIYNAQNKGWKLAVGEYCLFLNAGDRLFHHHVIEQVESLLTNQSIVCFDLAFEYDQYSIQKSIPNRIDEKYMSSSSLFHPSTFIFRELLAALNGYNEDFRIVADYDFFLRALFDYNASVKIVHYITSVFDTKGLSSSPESRSKQQEERLMSIHLIKNKKSKQKLLSEFKSSQSLFSIFKRKIITSIQHRFNRI